jgi:hypothetical protein
MQREMLRLEACGAWERSHNSRYVSRAFLVPKGKSNWRLIIDPRQVNECCRRMGMKFETLRKLRNMSRQKDWMFSLDLADGFYALGIAEEFRDYFTVSIRGQLWRLAALPMGWCLSPYYFCSLMAVMVRFIRCSARRSNMKRARGRQRIAVLPYVDDFLFVAPTLPAALALRDRVEALLSRLGLSRNTKKGVWEPTQSLEHLGMIVDLQRGMFIAPQSKLLGIAKLARDILCRAAARRRRVPVKTLATLAGQAQFLYLAIPVARFYLRELHDVMNLRAGWASQVALSKQLLRDLRWWTAVPLERNGADIFAAQESAVMHSDSSQYGWGAVLNSSKEARGFWCGPDRLEHITWKELKAVRMAVLSFLPHLRNRRVLLHEDNQSVVGVLCKLTSRSPVMMTELRKLWLLLDENNIWLVPTYIRSATNVWADRLSRELDSMDWQLNPKVFRYLCQLWGKPVVDCFASENNTQVPRFFSKWMCPGSAGVDCFSRPMLEWRSAHNWCNPPWDMLPLLLRTLRATGAEATVLAPYWVEQTWFRGLMQLADSCKVLEPTRDMFWSGRAGNRRAIQCPAWKVLALHIPLSLPLQV